MHIVSRSEGQRECIPWSFRAASTSDIVAKSKRFN